MYWIDSGALPQYVCQRVPCHIQPMKCLTKEWVFHTAEGLTGHPCFFAHCQCIAVLLCLVKWIYVLYYLVLTKLTLVK